MHTTSLAGFHSSFKVATEQCVYRRRCIPLYAGDDASEMVRINKERNPSIFFPLISICDRSNAKFGIEIVWIFFRVLHWQPNAGTTVSTQILNEVSQCVESINGVKEGRWKAALTSYKPMLRGYNLKQFFCKKKKS